jgi:hypothetical protein
MSGARRVAVSLLATFGVVLTPSVTAAQVALHGRAELGRVEHRVRDGGGVEASSGAVFGGMLGLAIGSRFEVWGQASGGRLAADSPEGEDRNFAEVQLLGGARLRPWLMLQGGAIVRSYSNQLARQRWATLRLGAEAHVPLALEGVRGVLRGQWMPVVSVSGLPRPDVALAAGAGVEWHGSRVSLGALYTLERYDFPVSAGARRLEELSSLQFRGTMRFHTIGATGRM